MTDTFKRHMTAIEAGQITKTNVIGLRKIFNHCARLDARLTGNRCNVTQDQAYQLQQAIAQHKPRIGGELHDSGIALLNNKRYARQLAPYTDSIACIDHFKLAGFEWLDSLHCVPIYQVWCKIPLKGDSLDDGLYHAFTFRNVAWQSGGNGPEVIT